MAIATPTDIGGYDYIFVATPPDRLVCQICHLPSRVPYLSVCCGHNFCKTCLDDYKKATTICTKVCPVCRDEKFIRVPNKLSDREIRGLYVMCNNKERGCEWQGELNNVNNHLENSDGCQFEDVKCLNECGEVLQRQHLTNHIENECPRRKVDCQYCHIAGEHQFIEGDHEEQCPKLPLPCPNKCEVENVPREDMEVHRKECPFEMVQCEYHNVGCGEVIVRKKRKKHEEEKMEEHLLMTKVKLAKTEEKLMITESRLGRLEVMIHRLINTTGHSNMLIDSTERSVHLTTMATSGEAVICPVVMKMSQFAEFKENGVNWTSDPFYSHNRGYKMCLRVAAAGDYDGKGTHLSVFLFLMKGPHDEELTWPLRGNFEFKLLNQISDCEHHSKTMKYDDDDDEDITRRVTDRDIATTGLGYDQYISNENLQKVTPTCHYIKDDCVFFQICKL